MIRNFTLGLAGRRLRIAAGRLRRGHWLGLAAAARRSIEVAPALVERRRGPRLPEGHVARVLRGANGEDAATAQRQLTATTFVHDATVAHCFDEGTLVGDRLYVGGARCHLHACSKPGLFERAPAVVDGVLASCYSAARWFGHYLHDELPLRLLAPAFGEPFAHRRPAWAHEPGYEVAFEMPPVRRHGLLRVERCVVIEDHAQNLDKQRRYRELRERLDLRGVAGRRVYLRRRGGQPRTLLSEDLLLPRLIAEGFTIVDTGAADPAPIIDALRGAEMVLGVDGSHLAPALLFAADGATIVSIMPPKRCTPTLSDIGTVIGHDMAVFVARADGDDFAIDADELFGFLDPSRADRRSQHALRAAPSLLDPQLPIRK